jgi:hypothetical protein
MNINLPELRANLEEAYAQLAPLENSLAQKACDHIDRALKALPPPDWITEKEAAERLGIVSRQVLRLLVHYQGLKYEFVSNCMMMPPSELDRIPNNLLQDVWELKDDYPPPEMGPIRENIMAQRVARGVK